MKMLGLKDGPVSQENAVHEKFGFGKFGGFLERWG
jgi:hypothetical protein